MRLPLSIVAVAVAAAVVMAVAAGQARAAPPHEHGVARLDVAVEPTRVTLTLTTPLENLVGFERAPRNDAERDRAAAALARLRDAASMFRLPAAAGCKPDAVELLAPALDAAGSGAAAKDGHAELEGHFDFRCSAAANANAVEVGLFEAFAALRRIELQVVTPKGQLKATLLRPASRVVLVR